jgi:hypothetical protein
MRVNACPGAEVPTVTRPMVASLALPVTLPAALSLALVLAAPAVAGDGLILRFGADGSFGPSETTRSFAKHYSGGELIAPLPETALVPDTAEGSRADRLRVRPVPPARPEILALITETAARYAGHEALRAVGLSASDWALLFQSNIEIESAYSPGALSHAGAIGLGQLMPDTARSLGVDPYDIAQNLDGSARYLLMRLAQFGSPELALAAYNAGAGAVIRHDGIPPYPETIGHVRKVMAVFDRLQGEIL